MLAPRRILLFAVIANAAFVAVLAVLKRALPSEGDAYSDEVALAVIMEGKTVRSHAAAFRGGSVLTLAAGAALDLRGATLAPGGGFLEVRTVMGGTSIAVPDSWQVIVRGHGILGAVVDRTKSAATDGDALTIDALAVMGSIEVANELASMGGPLPAPAGAEPEFGVVPTVV